MGNIAGLLASIVNVYYWILIARILLTWLPNINWYNQPFQFMRDITDPVMAPFRRLIPPIGGLDFSPALLIFLLGLLKNWLENMAYSGAMLP